MKKRPIIIIHFILLIGILNINDFVRADNQLPELNPIKIEETIEKNDSKEDSDDKDTPVIQTKILKKEIQNRKKYHKNLVNMYNKNFDSHYFELIRDNSLQIQSLEKLI